MANRCILVVLLVCFCTTALSKGYNLLRFQQRSRNLANQRILGQLNASSTDCLQQRMNSTLPKEVMNPPRLQKEDAVFVTYEMLQQIFGIFGRNHTSTGWNEIIIEKLLMNIYGQMMQLEPILDEIAEEDKFTWANKTILKLKKYYFSLVCYLQDNECSSCAWVIVKREIFRNIFFLNRLTDYLPN
ncbi:interferon beta [Talpa occidentalis]|uniref:interferon beta n=1 Tax=Talpa occidentalis TaxID=50954 RepID=UPI00188E9929|nr:interferon beta [Talpa occidentalis]